MFTRFLKPCALAWLILSATISTAADNSGDDPPDRVARLAYLQGAVSMQPAGSDDWTEAAINRPLTTGDKLWVDRSSRAELQAGSANIHVDQATGFSFLELSDDVLQMRVTDGAINVNVRRLREAEVIEIDTPNAAVTVTEPGEYHIEVSDDGANTIVKNYSGECEVADNNRHITRVRAHQQVNVSNDENSFIARGAFEPRDDFDAWANDRNQRYQRSVSARYVSPDVIGYADLDDQGDWISERDYGYVWYPTHVAVGWSPYRFGHWAWVAPWGWTWVDDAQWGFAPFHYGRWALVRNRWGWVPGPMRVRAVYAPALVAWVGSPGLSVSVSIGSGIGWFPLAPREVYVPGYRCSERHLRNVNYANTVIVNRTLINNVSVNHATHVNYAYGRNPRAVTVVQRDTFVGARPVHNHMVTVKDRELRAWRTQDSAPAIAPDRASALGPRWNASTSRNMNGWRDREVVARHMPPSRASFAQEQQAIRANAGRPTGRNELWRSEREPREVRSINAPRSRVEANENLQTSPSPLATREATRRRMQDRPQPEPRDTNAQSGEVERTHEMTRDNARRFDRGPQYRVDPRRQLRPEPSTEINQQNQQQPNMGGERSQRDNPSELRNEGYWERRHPQIPNAGAQKREMPAPVMRQPERPAHPPERQERHFEPPQRERVERPSPPITQQAVPQQSPPRAVQPEREEHRRNHARRDES